MKKLLFILLTLISIQSFAQDTTYVKVRGIPGAYNFSKNAGGDSIIFYVQNVRHALSVGTVVDLTPFLRKSDTASMLLPYLRKSDATDIYQPKGTYATGTGTANGTNTGDETLSSIKSKLGITTLSGSNTGDQDLSGLVPKTTTINGHALSSNQIISASDLTTGTLPHAQLPTLLSTDIPNITESQVTNLITDLAAKQATLVSGTNIKTVGGVSVLGSGDIPISGGGYTLDTTTANTGLTTLYQNTFNAKDTDFIIKTVFLNDFQTNGSGFSNFNGGTSSYDGTNKRLTVVASATTKGVQVSGSPLVTGHRYTVQVSINIGTLTTSLQLVNKYGTTLLFMPSTKTYYYTFVADVTDAFSQTTLYLYTQGAGTFYINYLRIQEVPTNYEYATKGDINVLLPYINTSNGSVVIGGGARDSLTNVTGTSTVIGKNAYSSKYNSVVIGESAQSFNSPYASSVNGEGVAIGYMAQAGDWRAIAVGGRAQALAVSSSAFGYGTYVNVGHAQVWGRGGYNPIGGTLFYRDRQTSGEDNWFFGSVGAKFNNPAMPGGEQTDNSSYLNAGTVVNVLRGVPGTDLMTTPTLTNTRGGYIRLAGGQSTGTAAGGNAQISVTLPGATSNNATNPDFVAVDVSGADGTVKFNAIPTGTSSDSVIVENNGTIKKIAQSSISGGYVLDTTTANTGVTTLYRNSLKADDNTVVHLSGAETITGAKTFTAVSNFNYDVHVSSTNGLYAQYLRGTQNTNDIVLNSTINLNRAVSITQQSTSSPDASAQLDVESTSKGVLLTPMTTTQFSAIASKAEGLQAYDLTTHRPAWYDGAAIRHPMWQSDTSSLPISTATQTALNAKVDTSYRDTWTTIDPVVSDTINKTLGLRQSFVDSIRIGDFGGTGGTGTSTLDTVRSSKDSILFFLNNNHPAGTIQEARHNTILGSYAFKNSSGITLKGNYNTWLGSNSDGYATIGLTKMDNSVFLGENITSTKDSLNNAIVIGNDNTATKDNQVRLGNSSTTETIFRGRWLSYGATPTVAIGSTLTGSASITGTNTAGRITVNVTTGTAYAVSAVIATVTFSDTYDQAPVVVITPASKDAALFDAGKFFVISTTTGFTINTSVSGTSVVASDDNFNYIVIQQQ